MVADLWHRIDAGLSLSPCNFKGAGENFKVFLHADFDN